MAKLTSNKWLLLTLLAPFILISCSKKKFNEDVFLKKIDVDLEKLLGTKIKDEFSLKDSIKFTEFGIIVKEIESYDYSFTIIEDYYLEEVYFFDHRKAGFIVPINTFDCDKNPEFCRDIINNEYFIYDNQFISIEKWLNDRINKPIPRKILKVIFDRFIVHYKLKTINEDDIKKCNLGKAQEHLRSALKRDFLYSYFNDENDGIINKIYFYKVLNLNDKSDLYDTNNKCNNPYRVFTYCLYVP